MQITKSTEIGRNLSPAVLIAAALLPLAALSCHSGPPRDAGRPAEFHAPTPLVSEATFREPSIKVRGTLAAGGMAMPGPGGGGARRPTGGGGMGGPPPGMGGPGGQSMGGGGPVGGGGAGPSHTLTVAFTNTGTETIEFTIVDVKSRLGNFVAQPDTLALAPGQQGTLYPMRGSLPDDIGELELTVSIRTTDGRTETSVLLLKPAAAGGA